MGLNVAMMRVSVTLSSVRRTTLFEYLIRFVLGGIITAVAGVIATRFGPAAGGLFLAFPAIFPASATLVEKHEIEKKRSHGLDGRIRGRKAAALDAAGAAIGSIGLFGFAIFVEELVGKFHPWIILVGGTILWFLIAVLIWRLRKGRLLKRLRKYIRQREWFWHFPLSSFRPPQ